MPLGAQPIFFTNGSAISRRHPLPTGISGKGPGS
jgi:hypothetical protein